MLPFWILSSKLRNIYQEDPTPVEGGPLHFLLEVESHDWPIILQVARHLFLLDVASWVTGISHLCTLFLAIPTEFCVGTFFTPEDLGLRLASWLKVSRVERARHRANASYPPILRPGPHICPSSLPLSSVGNSSKEVEEGQNSVISRS